MVVGVGIDLIEVARIERSVTSTESFMSKVFSSKEVDKCLKSNNKYQCLAARFAGKEAFMKAIGTGWSKGIKWTEIQILNHESGQPYLCLSGKAEEAVQQLGVERMHISLSHLAEIASAVVVLEKEY